QGVTVKPTLVCYFRRRAYRSDEAGFFLRRMSPLGTKRTWRDGLPIVRSRGWSQRVDATLYPERERWSVRQCVEVIFEALRHQRKQSFGDRWQRGESLKAIGRAFGKPSSSIYFQLAPHGGIRPPPRRRATSRRWSNVTRAMSC